LATKKWSFRKQFNANDIVTLSNLLGLNSVFTLIFYNRDITETEKLREYLNPSVNQLKDPSCLKDCIKAAQILNDAIVSNKKILLYGDYDVDGTTSVSMMSHFLNSLDFKNFSIYIPNRLTDGYGLTETGVKHILANSTDLLITLDCGTKSITEIELIKNNGIKVIICDHHNAGDVVPIADAFINPKQKDCSYPFKELSACGVTFKLIHAYSNLYLKNFNYLDYVDFVAQSIASDLVPIVEENRALMYLGLLKFNSNIRLGFDLLLKEAKTTNEVTTETLGFVLGPRINAAGRMKNAYFVTSLLTAEESEVGINFAHELQNLNEERKTIDNKITDEAIIEATKLVDEKLDAIVLFNENWHKGVIGIVASKIVEYTFKPTIIFTESDGMYVGSARTIDGINLYDAIKECDDLLDRWGGHNAAAGLSLKPENFSSFKEKFNSIISSIIRLNKVEPILYYDAEINLSDITLKFCKNLQRLAPFGMQNPVPVFCTFKAEIVLEAPRLLKNRHLKLTLLQNQKYFTAICFNYHGDKFEIGDIVDICYELSINVFNDSKYINMVIKDIRKNELR
jgi:single-stranded-DNA-specific exonuclease